MCQLNTLPLCNHDYIRDTDDHVNCKQCTLYNYTEHYNKLLERKGSSGYVFLVVGGGKGVGGGGGGS